MKKELKNKLEELADKYDKYCHYTEGGVKFGTEIALKKSFAVPGRSEGDDVIDFYTYNHWIYCDTADGWDTDPMYFDDKTLEEFINYISDESNLTFDEHVK